MRRGLSHLRLVWLDLLRSLVGVLVLELLIWLHLLYHLPVSTPTLIYIRGHRLLLSDKIVFPDHDGSPACGVGRLGLLKPLRLVPTSVGLRVFLEFEKGIFVCDVCSFALDLVVFRGCHHLLLAYLETCLSCDVGGTCC